MGTTLAVKAVREVKVVRVVLSAVMCLIKAVFIPEVEILAYVLCLANNHGAAAYNSW
ncbi:hypothetical protein J2T02_005580 [Chitinophaga terrae (ex Kim and Jung 2007)]|nr:hypothetical protein [Chitinophaga terrae (ex Kim and Jung 2007)]